MRRLETLGFRKTLPRPQKWVYLFIGLEINSKDQGKWSLSDQMLDTWHGLRFMWTRTKRRETLQLVSRIQKGSHNPLFFREKGISGRTNQKLTITIRQKKCQGQVFAYCTLVASRNLRQNSERRVQLLGQVRTITNQEKWIASNVQDQQDTN